jgi:hypothetical protein
VDRDGFPDLALSFDIGATGVGPGDTEVCLSGEIEGDAFRACADLDAYVPRPMAPRRGHRVR